MLKFVLVFFKLLCVLLKISDYAEKLFDLVDNFAESSKRKAAVWPLQIMLLILCPVSLFSFNNY